MAGNVHGGRAMREPAFSPDDPTLGAADGTGRDAWVTLDDGVRLHYVERGRGPLVVLLHGFPQYWGAWRAQIAALAAAGFRVVAPDLRGYNLSDRPASLAAYTQERLVWDVAMLIERLGERRAHVVGHDWGGAVAWTLAARHPERVDRLAILNAPHPAALRRAVRTSAQALRSWYVAAFQVPWLPERALAAGDFAILARALRHGPARPGAFSEVEIARHKATWRRPGALKATIGWYRALRRPGAQVTRGSVKVVAPTLVLWGMRDRYLDPSMSTGLERWVPNVRVVQFPEASHWLMHDEPERVSQELMDFLTA